MVFISTIIRENSTAKVKLVDWELPHIHGLKLLNLLLKASSAIICDMVYVCISIFYIMKFVFDLFFLAI